jgi:hypothetical protein
MVTFQRRLRVAALGLSVLALMATTMVEPVAAQVAPPGGVVEVTGSRGSLLTPDPSDP